MNIKANQLLLDIAEQNLLPLFNFPLSEEEKSFNLIAIGTGAQQAHILQILQQIASQISNTEGGSGGCDKVMRIVKVIHDHVSKNHKGSTYKSLTLIGPCYQSRGICSPIIGDNNMIGDNIIGLYEIDPLIVQSGDPINIVDSVGAQVAVGSPGAVQQLNRITEDVSLETGGDPAQVEGVLQNLALTNSIEGGNTRQIIDNIEMKVTQPNDPVSKSLNSLAVQEEQGNYEAVNSAIGKVVEGVVGGTDVEQLVTTAAVTTTEGAATLGGGTPSTDTDTGDDLSDDSGDDDGDDGGEEEG